MTMTVITIVSIMYRIALNITSEELQKSLNKIFILEESLTIL